MTTLDWVACALALPILLFVLRYAFGLSQLRSLRLQPRVSTAVAGDAVPSTLRSLLDTQVEQLRALGFAEFGYRRMPTVLETRVPLYAWFLHAVHPVSGAHAAVMQADAPEPGWLCDVWFTTYFDDGSLLITADGRAHQLATFRETLAIADDYTGELDRTWALHQSRCAPLCAGAITDPTMIEAREQATTQAMFDEAVARGRLQREPAGYFRLTWRGALDTLRQLTAGQGRRAAAYAARLARGVPQPSPALLAAADEQAMSPALLAVPAGEPSLGMRLALLVLTAALSWAAFSWSGDSQFAVLLVVTLALHEGGHYLAMRRFDYANLKVFFVPFLGAAVTGHREDARAWQRLTIYLAGPVPGLLLGLGLLGGFAFGGMSAATPWWMFGVLLVTVNYMNLLPLEPLDGGRVVSLLLFARHPRARVVTFALGIAGLFALAIVTGSAALAIFSALVAMALPSMQRQARMLLALRARGVPTTDRDAIVALCELLAQAPKPAPFAQRYATIKGLLPELRLPLPTRRETLIGTLCYLSVLLGPLLLVLALFGGGLMGLPGLPDLRALVLERRHEQRVADAGSDAARVDALLDAASFQLHVRVDEVRAATLLREAVTVADRLAADDHRRVDAVLLLAEAVDADEAQRVLADGLSRLPADTLPMQRSQLLESMALRASGELAAQRYAEVLALRERHAGVDDPDVAQLRHRYAEALAAAGDRERAERMLRWNLELAAARPAAAADDAWSLHGRVARVDLAWLLIGRGRTAEARGLLAQRAADAGTSLHERDTLALADAWAAFEAAQFDEAIATMSALRDAVASGAADDPVQRFLLGADLALFCSAAGREECVQRETASLRALLDDEATSWLADLVHDRLGDAALEPFQHWRHRRQARFLAQAGLIER